MTVRMAASDPLLKALMLAGVGTTVGAPAVASGVDLFDGSYGDIAGEYGINSLLTAAPLAAGALGAAIVDRADPAVGIYAGLGSSRGLETEERAKLSDRARQLVQAEMRLDPAISAQEAVERIGRRGARRFWGSVAGGGLLGAVPALMAMQDAPAAEGREQ